MARTVSDTVPFPVPDEPAETSIQETLLEAVHVQPVPAVTPAVKPPPAAPMLWALEGDTEGEHPEAWLTVKVAEPTVTVPLLAAPVLAATWINTDPLPVPEPDWTVIQLEFETAVH